MPHEQHGRSTNGRTGGHDTTESGSGTSSGSRRQAFAVIPALDVLDGRCVRLSGGRSDQVTIEGGDPGLAAARFAAAGARYLHLVDLGGAFSGLAAPGLVTRIVAAAGGVPVQAGGGLRDEEAVQAVLAAGAARAIVGTAALHAVEELAGRFGERLVVAVDARDGRVVAEGWTARSQLRPVELARRCAAAGVRRLLVTATARDGSLRGPDLALLEDVLEAGLPVLAAGGIASLADLGALRELGCEGAVVGTALWAKRFSLAQALAHVS